MCAVAGAAAAALDRLEKVAALQGISGVPSLYHKPVERCQRILLSCMLLLGSRPAATAARVGLVGVVFMMVLVLTITATVPKLAMQELSGARSLVVCCDATAVCRSSCCS